MSTGLVPSDRDALWCAFEPVGLDEIVTTADLQTRKDRKYLVPIQDLATVLDMHRHAARILTIDDRRAFRYRSTYFDTIELESYLGAERRRPRRFKVRTRHYVDTGTDMLEVKTRNQRGLTVKRRRPCDPREEHALSPDGRAFVAECLSGHTPALRLRPSLTTGYHRSTLVLPGDDARITVDVDLAWDSTDGRHLGVGDVALVETKTGGQPCAVDRSLWALGHRPVTISKYCTGLAALHPQLPANKWNRTLRRYFRWQPIRPVGALTSPTGTATDPVRLR